MILRIVVAVTLAAVSTGCGPGVPASPFGEYRGYSEPRFDSFVRQSVYIPVRDGTRIGVDIFRPAIDGEVASEPLPVALYVTRYWRGRELEDGSLFTFPGMIAPGDNGAPLIEPYNIARQLLRYGYVVMTMDSRGTGGSFGVQTSFMALETEDMREVIEWAAHQSWSTDKVGMFGASWPGIIQLIAAMAKPEPLAAIFPSVANFPDLYRILRTNGVYNKGAALTMRQTLVGLSEVEDQGQTGSTWGQTIEGKRVVGAARVDEDVDGALRDEARAGHGSASFSGYVDGILQHPTIKEAAAELGLETIDEILNTLFYADSLDMALEHHDALREKLAAARWPQPEESFDLTKRFLDAINESGVPTYLWDGWQDPAPNERLLYLYNLTVPTRLTVGPWSHGTGEPDDPREDAHASLMAIEAVRWFDFWLKGIENGINDEPKVTYAVMQDKSTWEWRTAETFPPTEAVETNFYFADGASGSVASINDGLLAMEQPQRGGSDDYTADYSLTTGNHTRMHDATGGGPIEYPDLAPNDAKALTFTTAPLEEDVVFAGFPVVTLYISSTSKDPSLAVYLEEVDEDGYSTLISQEFIRASHRTLWEPPYSTNNTPWNSSLAKDVETAAPLTERPVEIRLALEPASNRFDAGHRIRVTIATADEGVIWVIPESPRPVLTIWRDAERPSHLTLPVLPD